MARLANESGVHPHEIGQRNYRGNADPCDPNHHKRRVRVFDNILIERLWQTVKYEEVYTRSYDSLADARNSLI